MAFMRRAAGEGALGPAQGGVERRVTYQDRQDRPDPIGKYARRLSDKVRVAFHHACDQDELEAAEQLLRLLEMMLKRQPLTRDNRRARDQETLVAAYERLWHCGIRTSNDRPRAPPSNTPRARRTPTRRRPAPGAPVVGARAGGRSAARPPAGAAGGAIRPTASGPIRCDGSRRRRRAGRCCRIWRCVPADGRRFRLTVSFLVSYFRHACAAEADSEAVGGHAREPCGGQVHGRLGGR